MRFAIELAVSYVNAAITKEDRQTRKQYIMREYEISRSLLNDWIKSTQLDFTYHEEDLSGLLFEMSDYYKKHKLTGRKRKL